VFSRLFSILFHRRVFITLGLILLALLIWFAGPLFAFAEWRPLAPVSVRLWIIGLMFGLVLLRLVARYWREKRLNARMVDAVLGLRAQKDAPEDPNKPALDALRADFERALKQMRDTRFSSNEGGFWSRLGRRYVYQMPWYVFIGAPGSGKTTALVNSGLRFPLAQSLGKESVRGVGGTRSCDWWFAEEAVLLDTAGRYTTQESNAEADKAEWQGFLKLLKRFRPRQPLNGAILTVSVEDLLGSDEAGRKRHAERLRARLLELTAGLGIAFPIYVLVTKADQLGGFNEYFEGLGKEGRAQVWGATFELPATPEAGRDDLDALLSRELSSLNRRLFDRLPEVLLQELDPARRARAYALPQHFAGLQPLLRELLGEVFAGARFGPAAMLRGVYFTSGTQDGSSFDRLLGSLQRSLGFDARVSLPSQAQAGRSYFLHDLLHKVVLPEAHLAGRNRRAERRERWLGIAGHSAVAASLVLLVAGLLGSYRGNLSYLDYVDEGTRAVSEHLTALRQAGQLGLTPLLPLLGAIEHIADGPNFPVGEPPLRLRFGLYQGDKLDSAARSTYRRSLEAVLLPQVAARLHAVLAQAPADDLESAYEALRIYLMLHLPEHYVADEVEAFLLADFERSLPPALPPSQRAELAHHLHRLLHEGDVLPAQPMDEALVESVRERLAGFSLAQRGYSRLKRELGALPMREFTIAEAAGDRSAQVFTRASGKPITRGVPGLFTRHGYHKVFMPEVRSVLGRMESEEDWVLGRAAHHVGRQLEDQINGVLPRQMRELYLNDYREQWTAYLADLRLVRADSIVQGRETARILASRADSPLRKLLVAVARETKLSKPEEVKDSNSVAARLERRFNAERNSVERLVGPSSLLSGDRLEQNIEQMLVDDHFAALHQLVDGDGDGGSAPIDNVLGLFNELYMGLGQVEAAIAARSQAQPPVEVLGRVRSEAAYLPELLRGMVEGLADSSAQFADGNLRRSLASEIDAEVGEFCRRALADRYPFQRSSTQDVTAGDFQRLFAPGGLFDGYFQRSLAGRADTSGGSWVIRQPSGATLGLGSFQQAARIRDAFFARGGSMDLSFEFRVLSMDARIERLTLDFDGQSFPYWHGPERSFRVNWPSSSGSGVIRMIAASNSEGERSRSWSGPWALFRMFDAGDLRNTSGPERFVASFDIDGRKVQLEIIANSVANPYRLREVAGFRCPARA
jgi:type VI secretion system protein ImpL